MRCNKMIYKISMQREINLLREGDKVNFCGKTYKVNEKGRQGCFLYYDDSVGDYCNSQVFHDLGIEDPRSFVLGCVGEAGTGVFPEVSTLENLTLVVDRLKQIEAYSKPVEKHGKFKHGDVVRLLDNPYFGFYTEEGQLGQVIGKAAEYQRGDWVVDLGYDRLSFKDDELEFVR